MADRSRSYVDDDRKEYLLKKHIQAGWVLFGVGFVMPFLWCLGAVYIRSKNPKIRLPGILNFIFSCLAIAGIVVAVLTSAITAYT
jgi:uncharacterized membrane protein